MRYIQRCSGYDQDQKLSKEGVIAISYVSTRRIYEKLHAIKIHIITTDGRPVKFDESEGGGGYTDVEVHLHFHPVLFNEGE